MDVGRRGRKRQLVVEDEYWQLILAGVGKVEACRQVGIARTTGHRCWAERAGCHQCRMTEEQRSGRYFTRWERQRIATLRRRGLGVLSIAVELGRSPSTVSRALRRNRLRHDAKSYDGDSLTRAPGSGPGRLGRLGRDLELKVVIQSKLEQE